MVETTAYRKYKVRLEDYDYKKDIDNRLLMSQFSKDDVLFLEEIICSPSRIPITDLSHQVEKTTSEVLTLLEKFAPTGLFTQNKDTLIIDKEVRKYFETQLIQFEEDFAPGMDFLHSLLKKVPIHALLNWYPIPRTSDNIFQSLIEKYFQTPHTFQRYLTETDFEHPLLNHLVEDLSHSPNGKLYATDVKKKYNLTAEAFEEVMLHLEFNLIGCLSYEPQDDLFVEVITFFREWKEHLKFMAATLPKEIDAKSSICPIRPEDFSFIEDLSTVLTLAKEHKIYVELDYKERWVFEKSTLSLITAHCKGFDLTSEETQEFFFNYFCRIIQKLLTSKLATVEERQLIPGDHTSEWLELSLDERALHLYKLTLKYYTFSEFPSEICTDRHLHEIEKSVKRISKLGWVFFDDFIAGLTASISEGSKIVLKQTGRNWKYTEPSYSPIERTLIKKVVHEWFFEAGITSIGTFEGRECLRLTAFGKTLFA